MHSLILATLLSLPLYPVNPVKQDTLATMNVHVTAGVTAPNGVLNTGFEVSSNFELLVVHPFLIRGGLDYRFGNTMARRYPEGMVHGTTASIEGIVYRGTNKMTGFIGLGAVYSKYFMHLTQAASDSLITNEGIYGVYVEPSLGYRFMAGLRLRSAFSIELSVTSVTTDFLYRKSLGPNRYRQWRQAAKFRDFRVSFGYVLPLFDLHR